MEGEEHEDYCETFARPCALGPACLTATVLSAGVTKRVPVDKSEPRPLRRMWQPTVHNECGRPLPTMAVQYQGR